MRELIVAGFEGKHRAAEVLDQVQGLGFSGAIDLRDGVAVYRTDDGRLRVDQSVTLTTKEETAGGVLIGALIGVILALPFAAIASVPAAAAAIGAGGTVIGATSGGIMAYDDTTDWKTAYGIPDDFVKEVGGMIQPGQSAVFVLAQAADPAAVAERFRGFGGRILRTTLSDEQARKVQQTIAAQSQPVRA